MTDTVEVSSDERNEAAHLWNDVFGSPSEPFEGMSIGWKGQEASVRWLLGVRDAALDRGADDAIEVADGEVPIYTAEAYGILGELPLWVQTEDWNERIGLGPDTASADVAEQVRRTLFGVAYEIAAHVLADRY